MRTAVRRCKKQKTVAQACTFHWPSRGFCLVDHSPVGCHSIRARELRTGLEDNLLFFVRLRWFYTQLFYDWNSEANKDLEKAWLT